VQRQSGIIFTPGNAAAVVFLKILNFFIKIEYDFYILDRFDVLISKMIFKK